MSLKIEGIIMNFMASEKVEEIKENYVLDKSFF